MNNQGAVPAFSPSEAAFSSISYCTSLLEIYFAPDKISKCSDVPGGIAFYGVNNKIRETVY